MKKRLLFAIACILCSSLALTAQTFKLNESGYFTYKGVDAMSFNDYYPEGHQGGVAMIMHGKRVITNGDLRFEATPVFNATTGYGLNRADWSYIPGGGSSHYMFLVLATQHLLSE